ncbi:3-deoxy-manno-octulosonate cytidylyltransferase [Polaromonas eurypsychrophila]|nr:3-deoxy-manno-octulosonate cytidylyltransferase [Polaromonas eurypsychrophila]
MTRPKSARCAIVIPARFASTRLPGKPLVDILGKPMIQHVVERAREVAGIDVVLVATDDARVTQVVEAFGAQCMMTSPDHPSGTDRLVEVMSTIEADIYVNLQGDEPLVRPEDVALLVAGMQADPSIDVGTLCHPLPANEASNPNSVKVVLANNSNAIYFSRSPIPYPRDATRATYLKHVGVYAYRRRVLENFSALPQPMLEEAEKLEQLRLLAAGYRIRVFKVAPTGPGVDTPECLERVRAILSGKPEPLSSTLAQIKLVITDVDGVLTDGGIYYDATGECLKRFHVRDGMGIRMLEESGIRVAVVSGRDSPTLRKRMDDLRASFTMFGVKDKAAACIALMAQAGVTAEETACIGDDSIDLPAFEVCGLSFAVNDAPDYVKRAAGRSLTLGGGFRAFRELADKILIGSGKETFIKTARGYNTLMANMGQ